MVEKSSDLASDEDINIATSCANDYISQKVTTVAEEDDRMPDSSNMLNETSQGEEAGASLSHSHLSNGTSQGEEAGARPSSDSSTSLHGISQSEEDGVNTWVSEEGTNANAEDAVVNPLLFLMLPDLDNMTMRRSCRDRQPSEKAQQSSSSTIRHMFGLFTCFAVIAGGLQSMPRVSSLVSSSLHLFIGLCCTLRK